MRATPPWLLAGCVLFTGACSPNQRDESVGASESRFSSGGDYSPCTLSRSDILASTSPARASVIQRGFAWLDSGVKYSQKASYEGYRTDCSGFVSMCWQLDASYNTTAFYASNGENTELASYDDLVPGDALIRSGHASLFVGWSDSAHEAACVLELASTASNMQFRARSVSSLESAGTKAFRADGLLQDTGATQPSTTPPQASGDQGQETTPAPDSSGGAYVPSYAPPPELDDGSETPDAPSGSPAPLYPPAPAPAPPLPIGAGGSYVPSYPALPSLPITIGFPGSPSYPPAFPEPGEYGSGSTTPAPSSSTSPSPAAPSTPSTPGPSASSPLKTPPKTATAPAAEDSGQEPSEKSNGAPASTRRSPLPESSGGCSASPRGDSGNALPLVAVILAACMARRRRRVATTPLAA